ncbi:unnamed protein product, partial [Prorocentrum cordatum]
MTPLKISQVLAAGRDGAAAWEDPVPPGAPGVDLPKEGVGAPPRRQRARDRWVEAMSTIRAASSAQVTADQRALKRLLDASGRLAPALRELREKAVDRVVLEEALKAGPLSREEEAGLDDEEPLVQARPV